MIHDNMCPLKVTQIHLQGQVIVSLYIHVHVHTVIIIYIKFENISPRGQKPEGDT